MIGRYVRKYNILTLVEIFERGRKITAVINISLKEKETTTSQK